MSPTVTEGRSFNTSNPAARDAAKRAPIAARQWGVAPLQAGTGAPFTLVAAGAHQIPFQYWEAGRTPEPPIPPAGATPSNTLEDGGEYWYDGTVAVSTQGAEPGHCWPYMSPGPLQERQDPGDPDVGTSQYWPLCKLNQGINHYRRGFPFRKWMFGRRMGRFHIQTGGVISALDASNPTRKHCIEFAMVPNLTTAWNDGDGGTLSTPGSLPSARTAGFRTPDFSYNDLLVDGEVSTALFIADIWGFSVYRGISFWSAEVSLCVDGFSAPIFNERRLFFFSTTAVNFDTTNGNMAFLFKVDGQSPTTQLVTYSGTLSGTISAGDVVSKGGISGTVIEHDEDLETILVGRVSNASFGSSGTLTGPSGSVTITGSSDQYQPFGRINNVAWTASPGTDEWPPNVPQDGTSAVYQSDFFAVDFHPGL